MVESRSSAVPSGFETDLEVHVVDAALAHHSPLATEPVQNPREAFDTIVEIPEEPSEEEPFV